MDDTATALLMQRFYQNLLGQRPGLQQPMAKGAALAEAKRWLRGLSFQERDRLIADLESGSSRGKNPTIKAPRPKPPTGTPRPVDTMGDHQTDTPYAHPQYWSAFILIGSPE